MKGTAAARGIICDICSAPDPAWSYDCLDFASSVVDGWGSADGWAACDTCADLIDSGQITALVERAYAAQTEGLIVPAWKAAVIKLWLTESYAQFFRNRTSDRIPTNEYAARLAAKRGMWGSQLDSVIVPSGN